MTQKAVNARSHRRRRSTHKSKAVTTTEELVINRLLIATAIVIAVGFAAWLTMVASRR